MRKITLLIALLAAMLVLPCMAAVLEYPLPDTVQEDRAETLFKKLRCVVCQGESIADSRADVASDMRRDIRRRVSTGASDKDILDDMVKRYGEVILMTPPVTEVTLPLWLAPLLLLSAGGVAAAVYFRKRR